MMKRREEKRYLMLDIMQAYSSIRSKDTKIVCVENIPISLTIQIKSFLKLVHAIQLIENIYLFYESYIK